VLPFISITYEDVDEYESEPEIYIKNNLENTEADTMRSNSMKFVQKLSRKFSNGMQAYIENLIQRLLADYEQNRAQKWENITTLLNLLITASIGC